jgi:hypothetical protein
MKLRALAIAGTLSLLAASTAWADVQVSMHDGRVTIIAKDATLRQIMTEWARVGQTKIVNVERLPGGPQTLELKDVPEDHALDILMRSLSGYLAAPRALQSPTLSKFDRILVMPTVAAARAPATAASAPPPPVFQATPTFQPPVPQQVEDNDEPPAQQQNPQNPNGRGPVFTAFPQPQVVNPNAVPGNGQPFVPPPGMNLPGANPPPQPAVPAAVPTIPVGVAVPGMPVPAPQPPPGSPNSSTIRRPGGL